MVLEEDRLYIATQMEKVKAHFDAGYRLIEQSQSLQRGAILECLDPIPARVDDLAQAFNAKDVNIVNRTVSTSKQCLDDMDLALQQFEFADDKLCDEGGRHLDIVMNSFLDVLKRYAWKPKPSQSETH